MIALEPGTRATELPRVQGTLKFDEPMSRHTSWRTGGPADIYFEPRDLDDLQHFLKACDRTLPLLWIGLGSNLLVRDGGFRGVVINTNKGLAGLERAGPSGVRAGAGVPGAKIARFAARHDLCGAEFMAGIPGTLGGALAMNAGAFGSETWPIVDRVTLISRDGVITERPAGDFRYGYRYVEVPADHWFCDAVLALEPGDGRMSMERLKGYLDQRAASQPVQSANAGSVFRNPGGDHAARLIESCGLKGTRSGGAVISERHANFIVNDRGANSADIESLIRLMKETVRERAGIILETEVKITGEPK